MSDECYREWEGPGPVTPNGQRAWEAGWWCVNDHTGCIFNDGHNTCTAECDCESPLVPEICTHGWSKQKDG